MGGLFQRGVGRRAGRHVLLACCLLAAPARLPAQADPVRTFWVPTRSFNIPFSTDNDPRVQEVLLYAAGPGQPYRHAGTARPSDRRFFYQAPADGWYAFVVQTRDDRGALSPPDLNGAAPSLRIGVDTQRPVIDRLEATGANESFPVGITWQITEENLQEVRGSYRSAGGAEWLPLLIPPAEASRAQGRFYFKPALPGNLEVRLEARDRAGNQAVPKTLLLRVPSSVAGMAPPPEAPGSGSIPIMHVNSKTFSLQCELDEASKGPSGVARVEVWKLKPGGGWLKGSEFGDGTRRPISVTVETAGRWGFRLIPRNGVGLAERDPQPGDAPNVWVEVDDRAPLVKVTNVAVTPAAEGGYVTVYWKASDPFLRSNPITISIARTAQAGPGGWTAIVSDLANSGSWSCKTDDPKLNSMFEFYLKVTAVDEAGNVGEDVWRDLVKVDLKIPRVSGVKVLASPGGTAPPPADAPPPGQPMSRPLAPPGAPLQFNRP